MDEQFFIKITGINLPLSIAIFPQSLLSDAGAAYTYKNKML